MKTVAKTAEGCHMQITISNRRYIYEVQEEFQKEYPFLKLEFFRMTNKNSPPGAKLHAVSGKLIIGQARRVDTDGLLDISADRSVEEVENDFDNIFGLSAEIFRKSGTMWIETILTHHWSLHRQNQEGMQMS